MERRKQQRLYIHTKARIQLDDIQYDGYIENCSENGIGYLLTSALKMRDDSLLNKVFELALEILPDRTVSLQCRIMWTKRGAFSSTTVGLGMEIIDPPQEYIAWVDKQKTDYAADD